MDEGDNNTHTERSDGAAKMIAGRLHRVRRGTDLVSVLEYNI